MTQTEAATTPVRPTIVVGVDGSHANLGALMWAADEARRIGADVHLVAAIVQELRNHADMLFGGPVSTRRYRPASRPLKGSCVRPCRAKARSTPR
jgi:hypothetical protein